MAEPVSKTLPKLRIIYWGLKNRGNWARLICEVSGMPYEDQMDSAHIKSKIAAFCDLSSNPKVMAVPMLEVWDNPECDTSVTEPDLVIGQSAAVTRYLASISPRKGMMPEGERNQLKADMIFQNTNDYFADALPWKWEKIGAESLPAFLLSEQGRSSRWLTIFESQLSDDKPYFFGDLPSYADLGLYNLVSGFIECFDFLQPDLYQTHVLNRFPKIARLYKSVSEIEEVSSFIAKQNEAGITWWPPSLSKARVSPFIENMQKYIAEIDAAKSDASASK